MTAGTENLEQKQDQGGEIINWVGGTPVTRQGWTWLPLTQVLAWAFFTGQAARKKPGETIFHWTGEGLLKTAATLGSEWCHNLAHALASNLIGKPMDELRIQFGMPRCIYYQINDPSVAPREHVIRSLGGPVVNLVLLPISWLGKMLTRPDTVSGRAAELFYNTNLFLSLVALLPIPGIDGAPILKWTLVERGHTIEEADEVIRKTNGPLAILLGLTSSWFFSRKRIFLGFVSALLGLTSISVFAGWLKERDWQP